MVFYKMEVSLYICKTVTLKLSTLKYKNSHLSYLTQHLCPKINLTLKVFIIIKNTRLRKTEETQ